MCVRVVRPEVDGLLVRGERAREPAQLLERAPEAHVELHVRVAALDGAFVTVHGLAELSGLRVGDAEGGAEPRLVGRMRSCGFERRDRSFRVTELGERDT